MSPIGEFELIDRFFRRPNQDSSVEVPIGDDAAVVNIDGPLVVAADTLVSGAHFPVDLEPQAIGHRALAVNLSDLAAMGAEPRWATLALTIPAAQADWLEAFARGFFALADRFDVALIGGDTTRGPLVVTVQLMGTVSEHAPLLRSGGRIADAIYVSGSLGDAAAGVAALIGTDDVRPEQAPLLHRFAYPEPRVTLGRELGGVAHAAIDISDGLIGDLGHLCSSSACAANVDISLLPLSAALKECCSLDRAREFALSGGDDYELCFAADAAAADQLAGIAEATGIPITRIGELTPGEGVSCRLDGQPLSIPATGFRHF